MVKSKIFADANITNILNIRKFFAIFFKKFTISPSFINFCYQGKGKANESTSQQVNELKSDKSDRSDKRWV